MKKVITAIAAAVSLCAPLVASAQVASIGDPDCGTWVREQSNVWRAWIVGYLSGINASVGTPTKDPLSKITANQAWLWMDNFCHQNPLKRASDGGIALYNELRNGR